MHDFQPKFKQDQFFVFLYKFGNTNLLLKKKKNKKNATVVQSVVKLQKQQEITFIYHAGKHVQMRAFNRWKGICIEKSFCCILRLISLKIKCGNNDDTDGSYEVVSTENNFSVWARCNTL